MKPLITFIINLLLIFAAKAEISKLKICLTGSTEKALPQYGEAFVNGAKLAISELSIEFQNKVNIETHFYENSTLGAVKKLDEMRASNCHAIIGFSSGNDLLAIEDNLRKSPILTISIYGDPSISFLGTNFLRTMQPSPRELVTHLFKKIKTKIKKNSKVLIVTATDRIEMNDYKHEYLRKISPITKNITSINLLDQDNNFEKLNKIKGESNDFDILILLTRSLIAAELTDIFNNNKPKLILGTKYFGSIELPAYFNFLKNKSVEAYFARQNCTCDLSQDYLRFKRNYFNYFKTPPMAISSDAYDAIKFLSGHLYSKDFTTESMINFANNLKKPFKGISSFSVKPKFKVNYTKRFIIQITKDGYREYK
jgi:hypothetical protein